MSRFFIHVRCGDTLTEDPEGYDLPNVEAARDEALAAAREILANGLKSEGVSCEQPQRSPHFILFSAWHSSAMTCSTRSYSSSGAAFTAQ